MGLSKLTSIFDAILVPTCLHFASQNLSKPLQKPTPRGIKKLIDFCFDFCFIFAPFWKPSWTHVGHLSRPKTAQEASNTPPSRSKMALKTIPRAPQDPIQPGLATKTRVPHQPGGVPHPPRWYFGRFLVDFCYI